MSGLEALKNFISIDNKLVPIIEDWYELYLLGCKCMKQRGNDYFPKPLKSNAGLEKKRDRFFKQLICAQDNEFLYEVDAFLRNPKIEWVLESHEQRFGRNREEELHRRIQQYETTNKQLFNTLKYITSEGRINPYPRFWKEVGELGASKQKEQKIEEKFPVPLILAAYYHVSNANRQLQLIDQVEYADRYGFLEEMDALLRSFDNKEWERCDYSFLDDISISDFKFHREEKIFDESKTKLISAFSKLKKLEPTSTIYFEMEHMFAMFIARLYDLYSIEKDSLTALISNHEKEIKLWNLYIEAIEQEPEAYKDSEMEDYRTCVNTAELLIAKLQIVLIIQEINDEITSTESFADKYWDLLVERHIVDEKFL